MWKFREMSMGEDSVNPIQGEFFASEEIGDLSEVLVRETIQNSLDARIDKENGRAEIKFSYRKSNFTFEELQKGFMPLAGLLEHISAENSGLHHEKLPISTDIVDYLVIEDFGTKGLNGDPKYNDVECPVSQEKGKLFDFFFFWRNIGRSGKTDGLGSWGLGKHVFPAASKINSYFGLTIRSEDNKVLLMGKSILKIHHFKKSKYAPYGYFGEFGEDFFAMPFEDSHKIAKFTDIFKLRRKDEPGLSVIVPFPRIGLHSSQQLVEAILKDYFYPVIRNKLTVTIEYDGAEAIQIDSSTIQSVAHKYLSEDEMLLETIKLAIWSASISDDEIFQVDEPDLYKTPSVTDIKLPDEKLAQIRSTLDSKGRVAVRVPVRVADNQGPKKAEFDVCFAQTAIPKCESAKYVRHGIDVKNAYRAKLDPGCIALVEIHDLLLGNLLRLSEPPAHDRWEQRNNEDVLGDYDRPSSTIGFVKKSPHEIWRRISKKNVERNLDLLRDIFHLDINELTAGNTEIPGKRLKKKEEEEDIDLPQSPIRMVRTQRIVNGFIVSKDTNATHLPKTITIKVAYRISTGNHLKNYSPLDFRLNKSPILIEYVGVEKAKCIDNELIVNVLENEFSIKVTGFDSNRDLVVQVLPSREDDDDKEV